MNESILAQIRAHIVEQWLNGDERGLDADSDLQSNGVLDSFSTLALAAFLSEAFELELDPVDVNSETFRSLRTLTELVATKRSGLTAASSLR